MVTRDRLELLEVAGRRLQDLGHIVGPELGERRGERGLEVGVGEGVGGHSQTPHVP